MTAARKWTTPDGKTRAASEGPWIASGDINAFLNFCLAHGHPTRPSMGMHRGFDVQQGGHWMGLRWNKAFKRYTADRRLSLLVQSFAARNPALAVLT